MKKRKHVKRYKGGVAYVASWILVFSMLFSLNVMKVSAEETRYVLPENIRINKEDYDTIPAVIEKYKNLDPNNVVFIEQVNGSKLIQRINFIDFKNQHVQINGSMTFDIPEEIAKVARFFGDVRFEGEIAQDLQLSIINPKGQSFDWQILSGHYWNSPLGLPTTYTKTSWLSNLNTGLLEPWDMKDSNGNIIYDGYKLVLKGHGKLKDIYLWEEKGLSEEYDVTAYTVIGEDKPWLNVTLDVDATKNLSMNGVNKLDEDVYKRYHVNSGPIDIGTTDSSVTLLDKAYHMVTKDYGFLPGRGAFHFYGLEEWFGLKEDASKPGYTDYSLFDQQYQKNKAFIDKYDKLYPTIGNNYALTLDAWPSWQILPGGNPHYGTPELDKFEPAAELAGKLVAAIERKLDGRGPKYLEVKNESTISIEWPYLHTHPNNAWNYLSDFHNQVATKIKAESPDTLVGGPSSAFMYLEQNNFDEARKQLKFMDDTKHNLDYYSHHFYENGHLLINDEDSNPDGFLCGRLEAVFGLLKNHMAITGNDKPIIITEEGTYNIGGTEIDYFKKLRTYHGYMLRFMNLADSVDMIVPFLYPIINWRPDSNDTFYKYNATQTGLDGTTPLIHYLEMWKDYRGAFIPVLSNNNRVFTHAVRHGKKIYVAVQNLSLHRAYIDLNLNTGNANITDVKRKHTYLELGHLVNEEIGVPNMNRVPMRAEETCVFEITLDREPEFTHTLLKKSYYGNKTLQPTGGAPATFSVGCDTNGLERSVLRVGFGKSDTGFSQDMTIKVNNSVYNKDLEYTNKNGDFLGYVDIPVDKNNIQGQNTITVSIPENGGYITQVTLYNEYLKTKPIGVSTTALKNLVNEAKQNCQGITISNDGSGVTPGQPWVTQLVYDSYQVAIKRAEVVANDSIATREEVDKASHDLTAMGNIFSHSIIKFPHISFEHGEPVMYTLSDASKMSTEVQGQGATHGTKALKVNVNTLNKVNYGQYSEVILDNPNMWSIGKNKLALDVTNAESYSVQVRVLVTDEAGTTGTYYFNIEPNQNRTLKISQFEKCDDFFDGADGFWGLSQNGLDTGKLKTIKVCLWEGHSELANKSNASFIMDNIRITE
ncbi:hypothetical protein HZI73_20045 [Vallitalea pronyensis]|uniref:Beta-agarase n=1 Tax=Vallitalea pronyensis TaxID=1348613 RepID=A0A8J8SIG8_9FIRM|nr:hypothetical protein [Vallitalea pronyensis]QUI24449.1 hypothetical protein HZI73_20045 [Vallitalea pronyensis]